MSRGPVARPPMNSASEMGAFGATEDLACSVGDAVVCPVSFFKASSWPSCLPSGLAGGEAALGMSLLAAEQSVCSLAVAVQKQALT